MVKFVHFRHRNIPDRELIRDLRRVARKIGGHRMTGRRYRDHGAYGINTIAVRFGTWNKALEAADLKVIHHTGVSDAALLANIGDVWRKLGRQPASRELDKRSGFSKFAADSYRWRFGSWHKALCAFEAFANDQYRGVETSKRAKPKGRPSRDINWRLRATVLIRDNCLCRMCGASPAKDPAVTLHVDHIVPWSKGGPTVLANLQTLCARCNIGKGDIRMA